MPRVIRCPNCGAGAAPDRGIEESAFPWVCPSCGQGFEVRIVFLSRAEPVDPERFRVEVLQLLEEQGLTKSDLARLVGVTPAYISTLLSGRRKISGDVAARVLRTLRAGSPDHQVRPMGPRNLNTF